MQFYRYFKGHEKAGRWKPIAVEDEQEASLKAKYGFYTVLAVNYAVQATESVPENALYQGPFYIDIDSKDIAHSIKAVKKVIDRLRKFQLEPSEMNFWASGKKGFHVVIPMQVFCDDTALPRLPFVYANIARMANLFDIPEVDQSVYSTGRGRMWRIPNKKRLDNEAYKVALSVNEVADITPEKYIEYCKAPRPSLPLKINGHKNASMQAFYNLSIVRAAEYRKPKSTLIDQNLKDALGEQRVPPCVRHLVDGTNIRPERGFNMLSIQMNKALRAFIPDAEQDYYIDQFVENSQGDSHNTPESRREHLMRSRRTVQASSDYEWSCASILNILGKPPCDDCAICFIRDQQQIEEEQEERISLREMAQRLINADKPSAPEPAAAGSGEPPDDPPDGPPGDDPAPAPEPAKNPNAPPIDVPNSLEGLTITDDGYGFITGDGTFRRISNFVLRFVKTYYEYIPNLDQVRRVASYADVFVNKKRVGSVTIEDTSWQSKAPFIATFLGLGNCAFYGKDDDVQRMKSALMDGIEHSTAQIRRVHSCGIHHARVAEKDVFTYVEPGWSIDNYGNENTYSLSGQTQAAPRLKEVKPIDPRGGDSTTSDLLRALFRINTPENTARIIGWMMAAFLKQHVFAYRNEFPLLNVWGQAGAGKTSCTGMFAALHGAAYLSGDSPLSLGGEASSNFALWKFISSSMTVPRLIEEYNKKNLRQKYETFSEYFKECWNQHSVMRGTIKNSKHHGSNIIDASTVEIPMTGPVVLISEQSIQIPALLHRCIEVQLATNMRLSPDVARAWQTVHPRWRLLNRFARTAYLEALNITIDQVRNWIDSGADDFSLDIGDRPHYSFCVVQMGLRFLAHMSSQYRLGLEKEIEDMILNLRRYVSENVGKIAVEKRRTEVDLVFEEIIKLVQVSKDPNMQQWITDRYYLRRGDTLLIDALAMHMQYVRYMSSTRLPMAIENYNQFKQLLNKEDYCDSVGWQDSEFMPNRSVIKLDARKMAQRGMDVSVFEESK